jgi:hypothetical protein
LHVTPVLLLVRHVVIKRYASLRGARGHLSCVGADGLKAITTAAVV